jgi:hypothetical protein
VLTWTGYVTFWYGTDERAYAFLIAAAAGGAISLRLGRVMSRGSARARLASAIISAVCVLPAWYVTYEVVVR